MLLSSCVDLASPRPSRPSARECPGGDETLQRLIVERLDDALAWLESLGAPVVRARDGQSAYGGHAVRPARARRTRSSVRAGDVPGLRRLTARRAAGARHRRVRRRPRAAWRATSRPEAARAAREPVERGRRAATPALAAGGALTGGMDEFYGRNMPDAPSDEADFVPLAQLYAARATVVDGAGEPFLEQARQLVGDRRRPGDGAAAGRTCLVPARRRGARRPGRGGASRARARRRRAGARAARAAVRGARRRPLGVRVARRHHAHDGRPAGRRARAACCARTDRRSTGSTPRAWTPAASRRAATRAGSRRRSCSASPLPSTSADVQARAGRSRNMGLTR